MDANWLSKLQVMEAPIATPRVVRLTVDNSGVPSNGTPNAAAIRQALKEPNKNGSGAPIQYRKKPATNAKTSVMTWFRVSSRRLIASLYANVYNEAMIFSSENQAITCSREPIDQLMSGSIQPGDYLREQSVAEEFGISRTLVREALRKLETKGLLVSEPRLRMREPVLDYTEVLEIRSLVTTVLPWHSSTA